MSTGNLESNKWDELVVWTGNWRVFLQFIPTLGDGVLVALEEVFCLTLKIDKYDAVAEIGMAGNDESMDDDGVAVEPESDLNPGAARHWHDELDVAASATEVGGFEAHGDVAAFPADFDLDLDGVARMVATNRVRLEGWLRAGGWANPWIDSGNGRLQGSWSAHRQVGLD